MEILLFISLAIILYTYFGYGVIITLLAKLKKQASIQELKNDDFPEITLLIAAYNEEDIILEKIKNTLKLVYPKDKLNISFVTDGSSDETNAIIKRHSELQLFYKKERKGKNAAINRVMPLIKTPICIFSDANVMINKNALKAIVKQFQNNLIGAVSGEKVVLQKEADGASASGEGFYWKYESFLKKKDAEWNSLVGSAGEFFAIRTHLYENIQESILIEDFLLTMKIAKKGYKVGYEPSAIATETASLNMIEESKRKVRISAGGIQAVIKLKDLLNPMNFGKLSFQYVSHRVLRWTLMPIALILTMVLSAVLKDVSWVYGVLFKMQLGFYLLALIGYLIRNKRTQIKLVYVPYYFTYMHYCVVLGWISYFNGKQKVTWKKALRSQLILEKN